MNYRISRHQQSTLCMRARERQGLFEKSFKIRLEYSREKKQAKNSPQIQDAKQNQPLSSASTPVLKVCSE